jgi:leucyl-tRNA synthetase
MDDYQPVESAEPQPLLGQGDRLGEHDRRRGRRRGLPADAHVRRETNTMPGWAGLVLVLPALLRPEERERFIGRDADRGWMLKPKPGVSREEIEQYGTFPPDLAQPGGVDLYVGGAEHAVLHLLYARFWHKVLFDLGEVMTPEPFQKLFHQGLILSHAYQRADKSLVPVDEVENRGTEDEPVFIETATGDPVQQIVAKMSKSLRNVVNPDDVIAEFGADTFRLYEMYMGPLEQSKPWDTRAIGGMFRFLRDAWRLCIDEATGEPRVAEAADGRGDEAIEKALHRTIAKVGGDIEKLAFNTAIAAMIEFKNAATPKGGLDNSPGTLTRDQIDRFTRVLSPFAPHLADEIADRLGLLAEHAVASLAQAPWPAFDEAMLTDDEVEIPVQILGKVRGKVTVPADADQKLMEDAALNDEKIRAQLEGKTVRKVIVVPGRLVNIVAN